MRRSYGWLAPVALTVLLLAGIIIFLAQKEQPAGWIAGKVASEETGVPLSDAMVNLTLVSPYYPGVESNYSFRTGEDGRFASGRLPAGIYSLGAASRAHELHAPARIVIQEGQASRPLHLELEPKPPYFDLRMQQNVFSPDETPQIIGHGFSAESHLELTIYRVSSEAFREKRGNIRAIIYRPIRDRYHSRELFLEDNPDLAVAGRFSLPITEKDIEGVFHQRFDVPFHTPGTYVLHAKVGQLQEINWLMLTRIGLITKQWQDKVLAYVTDLKSGRPVPGAAVWVGQTKVGVVSGTTNDQGIFIADMSRAAPYPYKGDEDDHYNFMLAQAEKDGSQAALTEYLWHHGDDRENRIYTYTDRPVYRPGHTVNFKGIVRAYTDKDYAVPAHKPLKVEVWDPRQTLVYKKELTTNDFGSYFDSLALNQEAATGRYRLVTTIDDRPYHSSFYVAEYRKPEYSVTVTTGKKRYTRGETIEATIAGEYYFGAPVAGAKVTYTVRRAPHWGYYGGYYDDYYYEDYEGGYEGGYYGYGGYGEVVEEGFAKTDENGRARITVRTKPPVRPSSKRRDETSRDYRYTIEAWVTDPSRKSVSAEGSTLVTQGEFRLFASPARYVSDVGEPARISIQAADYDDKPVTNASVLITAELERWDGRQYRTEETALTEVTTDQQGKASFSFTPEKHGSYRIRARATDARGNRIVTSCYLWVTSYDYYDMQVPYPDLEIVPDKKEYREGDTATLLINTKDKGATALVTIEGPRLYEHRLLELKGNSTRLEIPIIEDYAPNFFVGVSFVRDKHFINRGKRLGVSVEKRALRVEVKPDKARYAPGEEATYRLTTRDWQGRPVSAELSLGLVDESVYAVREDSTPAPINFFYPQRSNGVRTFYSFPHIYLDADKEAQDIAVRKKFPDTAYWNPVVVTGEDGTAEVALTIPDTLTTWRATVRGATLDTAVGQAVSKVLCSKDLLLRLETPRFFAQRDRLVISAVAHNYTSQTQDVQVWIDAPGLKLIDAVDRPLDFSLAPEEIRRIDWQIEIPAPGKRAITAYMKAASGLSDAMQLTIPALPHGRERVEWRSGSVDKTAGERLSVRVDAVPQASSLTVRLTPSIASMALGSLEYLARYPYGCTEQTMSAFLPDIFVARALRELDISNPKLEAELPDMVQKGLNRLYRFQHDDGGWGWWRYDDSDLWMTSYVVFGLLTAQENGIEVNERILNRGLDWLYQQIDRRNLGNNKNFSRKRAYLLYVLSLAGKNGPVKEEILKFAKNYQALDTYTLALTAASLKLWQSEGPARNLARELWNRAEETQALLHWPGTGRWGMANDTETTALVLRTLLSISPRDERYSKVLRWLVLRRSGNHWASTRDTAFVIFAVTEYLRDSQELSPDYEAALTFDGQPLFSRGFARADIFAPEIAVAIPADKLTAGEHIIEFAKEGEGNLYYTLTLSQYIDQEEIPRLITGAGISITREYFPLAASRNPHTGVIATRPADTPTRELFAGEPVLVRVTINASKNYEYIVIEDPLPSGCEVTERGDLDPWDWRHWWSDMDIRDEKIAFFARELRAGTHTIEYHLRPEIPGDYHVMPTTAYSMYDPEVRGSGAETRILTREKR